MPYRPSRDFMVVMTAFLALCILFVAIPHVAVSLTSAPVVLPPFTVGVDPKTKTITERETLSFTGASLMAAAAQGAGDSTQYLAAAIMSTKAYEIFDPLPQPVAIRIVPGMRLEQVASILDYELDWSKEQHDIFIREAGNVEGKLYPSVYVLPAGTTPVEAAHSIADRFGQRVGSRYASSTEALVPMVDALTLASIIEREAGDESEMATISGILWNRQFKNMKLQADSTLQYVRGTARNGWWPVPRSKDKYLKSPYNTYQNTGLPPGPIASPSVAAIYAALNPEKTDCLFFFHAKGAFTCSVTYEEHVKKLKKIYGRGK